MKGLCPPQGPRVTHLELHPWVRAYVSSCHVGNGEKEPSLASEVNWEPRGFLSISPAYLFPLALYTLSPLGALPSL